MRITLRPYQEKALDEIRGCYRDGIKKVLLHLATGAGKCHGKGTLLIMFDGSLKAVEDIVVGDLLMGPDSTPRKVLSLARGIDMLCEVVPVKGQSWVGNKSHILSLTDSVTGNIVNISIEDWLNKNKTFKHRHKLYKVAVNFPVKNIKYNPYALGMYLAEGSKDAPRITNPDKEILEWTKAWADENSLNIRDREGQGCRELYFRSKKQGWFKNHCDSLRKHCTSSESRWIPKEYLYNSRNIRLKVLAGLLDGDGHLNHNGYEIITQHIQLRDDIAYLCGSLGYAVYFSPKIVKGKTYWRISINGDVNDIPCKVKRKKASPRRQKKNVLRNGFKIKEIGLGNYYGFTLTGDSLYLLHDFTVTHNTAIFCEILKSAKAKGTKAIMVVRGKALVDQASLRLTHMDVPHGVMQANHWRRMPDEPIQICSIDTLYRRRLIPPADLIVIDEAHLASSESYLWLCKQYPHAFFLPVSATPHVKKGLRHVADKVVYPITMKDLIRDGYLVPATYFLPSKPNLDGVEIDKKTHDYKQDQLEKRMRNTVIYGHLSHSYKTYGQNRPALAFAVTVEHSLEMVEAFNAAGIPSAHMEAETSMPERVRMIKDLEEGRIKIISNVGVLTTGVDIPCASCIILARPTKSYNLYIQILGRGTRTYPGKENFIVLDHASNVPEHGFIETERVCNLDGKEGKPVENSYITCDVCWHTWNPIEQYRENNEGRNGRDYLCKLCGRDMTPVKAIAEVEHTIITAPSEMVEVKDLTELETAQMLQYIEAKYRIMRLKGYKKGWIYYQLREKFGETNANRIWSVVKKRLVETPS